MLLAEAPSMVRTPDSFDPPLKRTEAAVPGYWTAEELANELEVSIRTVQYLIKGNPKTNLPACFKVYNAGKTSLISDAEALDYLWNSRQSKKKP